MPPPLDPEFPLRSARLLAAMRAAPRTHQDRFVHRLAADLAIKALSRADKRLGDADGAGLQAAVAAMADGLAMLLQASCRPEATTAERRAAVDGVLEFIKAMATFRLLGDAGPWESLLARHG